MNQYTINAYNNLGTNMRLLIENLMNSRLIKIDPEEYICNVEAAFISVLESFHVLYDNTNNSFNYFNHGSTALLILMRNALHHKKEHELFDSLFKNMFYKKEKKNKIKLYSYNEWTVSELYFKVQDFYKIFGISRFSNRKTENIGLFERDLFFKEINTKQKNKQKYFNIMPVFSEAIYLVTQHLIDEGINITDKDHFDGGTYFNLFSKEHHYRIKSYIDIN